MAKGGRESIIQKDLKSLISSVTGFDEHDENFKLCVQFAESKFKYHRYLTVDSHNIHRALDGLCEKFQVASQGQKAADLTDLVTQFLDQPGLDGKGYDKTDVHYGMLSLLINLAQNPTNSEYERKKQEVLPDAVDDFDWKDYLLDAEDVMFLSHGSSESEEEEEDLESPTSEKEEKTVHFAEECEYSHGPLDIISHNDPPSLLVDTQDEYAELESRLVVEYWKGKAKEEGAGGGHAACNIARDWRRYQQSLEPFQVLPNQAVLTEAQIVREVLWMMAGRTNLFVFKHGSGGFTLNPDVYVLHLTPEALSSSLASLMRSAQQVHILDAFDDVVCQSFSHSDSTIANRSQPPLTYKAFSVCISDFLASFREFLVEIEIKIMKQEKPVLLSSLTSDLQPWINKIKALHTVVLHGVTPMLGSNIDAAFVNDDVSAENVFDGGDRTNESRDNNCSRATLLLDTLYRSLLQANLLALEDGGELASLMLNMLVKTSEPVLQVISEWINKGVLNDPGDDFVLYRNRNIKPRNETFWDKAFEPSVPILPQEDGSSANNSQTLSRAVSHASRNMSSTSQSATKGFSDPIDMLTSAGPKLLQPVLREVVLTGKSMALLENLGKFWEAVNMNSNIFERPPTLYELFVSDLHEAFSSAKGENMTPTFRFNDKKTSKLCQMSKDTTIERLLNRSGFKDTLLNINFAALFSRVSEKEEEKHPQRLSSADCDHRPIMSVLENCLHHHVTKRYSVVCSKLVRIMKEEYDLMGCIHAMQRFYLMSAGDVMHDFYTPVFEKMERREDWRHYELLEMFLHDAVEPVFPKDVQRLFLEIDSEKIAKQKSAINATDCIRLKYKVPWPVDVVISAKCQGLYSDVFNFILQIKRAKFTLDQLRFDDLSREQAVPTSQLFQVSEDTTTRKCLLHQFHVMRFRLLCFVNNMHNYIMTRILHSTELEFGQQLDEAPDLDQIIHIHYEYVEAIHQRCMLDPRLTLLREAVSRVLNLSLTFSTLWRQGVDFASLTSVREVDDELTKCLHFLSSFLQKVIKRGSYPHLESLAFALSSSLQSK